MATKETDKKKLSWRMRVPRVILYRLSERSEHNFMFTKPINLHEDQFWFGEPRSPPYSDTDLLIRIVREIGSRYPDYYLVCPVYANNGYEIQIGVTGKAHQHNSRCATRDQIDLYNALERETIEEIGLVPREGLITLWEPFRSRWRRADRKDRTTLVGFFNATLPANKGGCRVRPPTDLELQALPREKITDDPSRRVASLVYGNLETLQELLAHSPGVGPNLDGHVGVALVPLRFIVPHLQRILRNHRLRSDERDGFLPLENQLGLIVQQTV